MDQFVQPKELEHALLPQRLRRHAARQSQKLAVAFLNDLGDVQDSWTFGELDRRARSIAAHLQKMELTDRRVVVAYPPGVEFCAAFMGCLYSGTVAIPACQPRANRTDDRLEGILDDSAAACVLTSSSIERSIARHLASRTKAQLVATDTLSDASEDWKPVSWLPDRLAFLQYTSGSTRIPRGVMVTHGNLAANLETGRLLFDFRTDSICVSWLPVFHDMGLIGGLLGALWEGYPTYLMAPASFVQRPLRWLQAISRYRGTVGGGPNFAYQLCVDAAKSADTSNLDLSSWRLAWNGAEPVRADTMEKFLAVFAPCGLRPQILTPTFGLAEATLVVTGDSGSSHYLDMHVDDVLLRENRVEPCAAEHRHARHLVSSGKPGQNVTVRIVDPDTFRELASDQVGEIWVAGPSVAKGYFNKPEETRDIFGAFTADPVAGPFLRTGDLGFLHRGELFVTGRRKDMLVVRGVSYYPQDIEQTVSSAHPALRLDATGVVGIEEGTRVRLVALQEVRRECLRQSDLKGIVDAIRRAVSREHLLALDAVVLLRPFSLPRTSSGKLQRTRCHSLLQASGENGMPAKGLHVVHHWQSPWNGVAPINLSGEPLTQPGVLERQLVDWLQQELAVKELTWQTPLIELGVDSLKAVELSNCLSESLDFSFAASLIIDYPTVEAIACLIRERVLERADSPKMSTAGVNEPRDLPEQIQNIQEMDEATLDAALQASISETLRGDT